MDRLSFLITPEYKLFWIGAGFFLLALGSAYFGVCPGRGCRIYRSREPKSFWFGVSAYFLGGVLFWIGFWYQSQ
jgi:hypothetical protein